MKHFSFFNVPQRALLFGACMAATVLTNAQQWSPVGNAQGISTGGSSYQRLVVDPAGNYYVSYYDVSVTKGSVMKFDGTSWNYVGGSAGVTPGTATYNALLTNTSGEVYYSFQDGTINFGKMSLMKYDGTAWSYLGGQGFSGGIVNYQDLKMGAGDTLLLAYRDASVSSGNMAVKKFDGTTWQNLGNQGFMPSTVYFTSMATNSLGQPFVSCVTGNNQFCVYELNGTTWQPVGGSVSVASASSSGLFRSAITVSADDTLYAAYTELSANGNKLSVMKYDGTSWAYVGSAGISAGAVAFVSIAVNAAGVPFVAYQDAANTNLATVQMFDGTQWQTLGTAGFSAGTATYLSLAIAADGQPLLAYADAGNGGKTMVMKYTPPCTASALTTLSHTMCQGDSLVFDGQTLITTGIYTDTLSNTTGCDSVVELTLTVNTLPQPTISLNGVVLSTGNFQSYQWLMNGQAISGATSSSYTITQNGDYSVLVSGVTTCTAVSTVLSFNSTGLESYGSSLLSIYPNPVLDVLHVQLPAVQTQLHGQLMTVDGNVQGTKTVTNSDTFEWSLEGLAPGLYFLQINGDNGFRGWTKLMKQ